MTTEQLKPAGGTTIRVTELDACGNPVPTGCYAVSECWAQLNRSPQYQDGVEFAPQNANGQLCFAERQPPGFKWWAIELQLNAVDPVMWQIITGAPLVVDDAAPPNTVGWRTRRDQMLDRYFSIELWMRQGGAVCAPGNVPYIYDLTPLVSQGKIMDLSVGLDVIHFGITEAIGTGPSSWGVGPYDVRRDAVTGFPEKLLTALATTIGSDDVQHTEVTHLAPPQPTSGCQPTFPVFAVAPTGGVSPLNVTGTFPLGPDGLPLLPGRIDWGDSTFTNVTSGTTAPHTYATPGTRTATYVSTAYSGPVYTSVPIVVT
jgi:hypothetical protein